MNEDETRDQVFPWRRRAIEEQKAEMDEELRPYLIQNMHQFDQFPFDVVTSQPFVLPIDLTGTELQFHQTDPPRGRNYTDGTVAGQENDPDQPVGNGYARAPIEFNADSWSRTGYETPWPSAEMRALYASRKPRTWREILACSNAWPKIPSELQELIALENAEPITFPPLGKFTFPTDLTLELWSSPPTKKDGDG